MREILFRGKTLDGDWIEGWYQPPAMGIGVTLAVFNDTSEHLTDIQVVPETVGQFTGVLDKNGKKIFEGDIIRLYCGIHGTYVMHILDIRHSFRPFENRVKEIEIIGNTHDNPELLEVKK